MKNVTKNIFKIVKIPFFAVYYLVFIAFFIVVLTFLNSGVVEETLAIYAARFFEWAIESFNL